METSIKSEGSMHRRSIGSRLAKISWEKMKTYSTHFSYNMMLNFPNHEPQNPILTEFQSFDVCFSIQCWHTCNNVFLMQDPAIAVYVQWEQKLF